MDPGSFIEYGRFTVAAQRARRDFAELIARTPADGLIGGTLRIDGRPCAVLSYDYPMLAGTQGVFGHRKKDRLFELIERMRLPTVFSPKAAGAWVRSVRTTSDPAEREEAVGCATAAAQQNAQALNAAALFEIDVVIDPADTRGLIAATFEAAAAGGGMSLPRRFVDTW